MKHDIIALFCISILFASALVMLGSEATALRLHVKRLEIRIENLESPPCEWSRAMETVPHKSKETK